MRSNPLWISDLSVTFLSFTFLLQQKFLVHLPTYNPTPVKNREDTDITPRKATGALHRLAETAHPRPPTLNEQTAHT